MEKHNHTTEEELGVAAKDHRPRYPTFDNELLFYDLKSKQKLWHQDTEGKHVAMCSS